MIYVIQRENSLEIFTHKGRAKGNFAFQRYEVSDYSELPKILSKINDKNVAVLGKFSSFSNDLVTIPRLKAGLAEKMIYKEAKSRFSNIKSPILVYNKVADITREGVAFNQAFIAAIETEETDPIITAIVSANKQCVYISLLPLVLGQLLKEYLEGENLFVACDQVYEKIYMLFSPKDLALVRVMPSDTEGFLPLDYENINQTITFCRESLRIFPSKLVFFITGKESVDLSQTIIPAEILTIGPQSDIPKVDFTTNLVLEFLDSHLKEIAWTNFLPEDYLIVRKKLRIYTGVFVFGCLFCASVLFNVVNNGIKAKQSMEDVSILEKRVASILPVFEQYKEARENYKRVLPLIEFHNQTISAKEVYPSIESILNYFDSRYKIDTIEAKREALGVTVRIAGKVISTELGSVVEDFDTLIREIGKKQGIKVIQTALDVKAKNFNVVFQVSM